MKIYSSEEIITNIANVLDIPAIEMEIIISTEFAGRLSKQLQNVPSGHEVNWEYVAKFVSAYLFDDYIIEYCDEPQYRKTLVYMGKTALEGNTRFARSYLIAECEKIQNGQQSEILNNIAFKKIEDKSIEDDRNLTIKILNTIVKGISFGQRHSYTKLYEDMKNNDMDFEVQARTWNYNRALKDLENKLEDAYDAINRDNLITLRDCAETMLYTLNASINVELVDDYGVIKQYLNEFDECLTLLLESNAKNRANRCNSNTSPNENKGDCKVLDASNLFLNKGDNQ